MQVWWGELISLWGTQDNPKNKTCHDEGVNRYKSHPSIRGKATDKLCIHSRNLVFAVVFPQEEAHVTITWWLVVAAWRVCM